jgi:hypothetical protein
LLEATGVLPSALVGDPIDDTLIDNVVGVAMVG